MIKILFLLFFFSVVSLDVIAEEKLSLFGYPKIVDGSAYLTMTLKNNSNYSIDLNKGALPWTDGVSGANFYAFASPHTEASTGLSKINSVGSLFGSIDIVTVGAKSGISGNLILESKFPGINKTLCHSDIFLFWRYLPIPKPGEMSPELSGGALLKIDAHAPGCK